jgi:hypothetical protein
LRQVDRLLHDQPQLREQVERMLSLMNVGESGTQPEEEPELPAGHEAEPNPNIEEGWEAGVLFTVMNQMLLERAGTYSIEIAVDGEHKKSVPFRVVPGETPPA